MLRVSAAQRLRLRIAVEMRAGPLNREFQHPEQLPHTVSWVTLSGVTEWDAAEYARHSSLQLAMAREALAQLKIEGAERILDVGCGQGKITAEISARSPQCQVVGVDASREMISFAQHHFASIPNLRFEVADARYLPFRQQFDLAVSFNALHWIRRQDLALRCIHSALSLRGRAQLRLVAAGPRKSLENVVEATCRTRRWSVYFQQFSDPYLHLTPDEYAALAERNGFRVLGVSLKDHAWDFGSRAAFAAFSAVGCVEWTRHLPEAEHSAFINDVLDRYGEVAANGDETGNIFKFYQMDLSLLAR